MYVSDTIPHLATCTFRNDCMYVAAVLPISVNPQEDVYLESDKITVSSKVSCTLTGKFYFGKLEPALSQKLVSNSASNIAYHILV